MWGCMMHLIYFIWLPLSNMRSLKSPWAHKHDQPDMKYSKMILMSVNAMERFKIIPQNDNTAQINQADEYPILYEKIQSKVIPTISSVVPIGEVRPLFVGCGSRNAWRAEFVLCADHGVICVPYHPSPRHREIWIWYTSSSSHIFVVVDSDM